MALGVLKHVCSLLGILLPFSGCGELKGEKVVVKREDKEQELQDTISEFWFYYILLLLFILFFFFLALGETWKNRLNIPTIESVFVACGLSDYEQYMTTWAMWNNSDTSVNEIQFLRAQISTTLSQLCTISLEHGINPRRSSWVKDI